MIQDQENSDTAHKQENVEQETQSIEVIPQVEVPLAQEVFVEPIQNNANLIPENLHTAASTEKQNDANSNSAFRPNVHTYDKVPQVQVSENLQTLQLENLHASAPVSVDQKREIPKPQQNVQSGPEENLVVLLTLCFASVAWFLMRRVRA